MRKLLFALFVMAFASPALAQNYTATAGAGLTFGAKSVTSVLYPQIVFCDPATPSQCVGVNSSGQMTIANTTFAATQSGAWSIANITGTVTLPTGASTSANQATNGATTAHTCATSGFSELGCLGQIDDDIKGSVAAGSNLIGKVGIDQTTPGTTNGVQAKITDGTNIVGVAPASTASVATQPALVVTQSQNCSTCLITGGATVTNSVPVIQTSQYPVNSVTTSPTPLVAKGAGTTGAVTGTLTPAATATAYVCGFSFSAIGGTANPGPLVLSGLLGGSFTYQLAPNSATIAQNFSQTFTPCIPASAVNTAIILTTTAAAGATATDVNIWGYGL